ncbi:hypothetical protein LWI28_013139 [Acer negundo]|uniref:Uncharacterized protein n=1 Tax=Acer negundo TaxID=4023 RepID=A0AAD5P491_ACENE|nr:hypothetical protein LWI28_013139 [Acer negundo]
MVIRSYELLMFGQHFSTTCSRAEYWFFIAGLSFSLMRAYSYGDNPTISSGECAQVHQDISAGSNLQYLLVLSTTLECRRVQPLSAGLFPQWELVPHNAAFDYGFILAVIRSYELLMFDHSFFLRLVLAQTTGPSSQACHSH